MRYQIRVAGKVFEGDDPRSLLKRAVEAKRRAARLAPLHSRRTANAGPESSTAAN
jgi:hypothetical protein